MIKRVFKWISPRCAVRACAGVVALALCGPALAFFPSGGFDTFDTLRFAKWRLADFDTNGDGNVSPGEGLEIQIEGGPAGFNAAEIEIIKKAFKTWSDVPTTYASFRVRGVFQDPITPSGLDINAVDGLSSIYLQVGLGQDTGEDVIPDVDAVDNLDDTLAGITLTLYAPDDTVIERNGQITNIAAGTILDRDIYMNSFWVRATSNTTPSVPTTKPLFGLQASMTEALGLFLGLNFTPLNNVRPELTGSISLLESPVLPYTGGDGIQRNIGVTPTMFPLQFFVADQSGARKDGQADLAPDDISAISYLYPRGSQSSFFTVNEEVRTQTRVDFPSSPIPGAHVVAWADQDGNPDTPRVPMFSTLSGMYELSDFPERGGLFRLLNLWKQVEVEGAANLFRTPTYAFTTSPLSGSQPDVDESYIRQQPPAITPETIDSMHDPLVGVDTRADYNSSFISEVFDETENILDVSNRDAGTGMVWSFESNNVLSAATGKNLDNILANRPMFGDPNDVCPLFVTEIPGGGTGTGTSTGTALGTLGNTKLRGFRDNMLLQSPLGTAFTSTYYRVAPAISNFLLKHTFAFEAFRAAKLGAYWMISNFTAIACILLSIAGLSLGLGFKRQRRGWGMAVAGLSLWMLIASSASAQFGYRSFPEFVAGASDIVSGKVLSTNARWGTHGRIYTDVTVEIGESAKGSLDKVNSTLTFSVVGGQLDGLGMGASGMPTFKVGEDLVIYLRKQSSNQYTIYGGVRGKVPVFVGGAKKTVEAESEAKQAIQAEKAKTGKTAADAEEKVSLDEYLNYVRELVAAQAEAAPKE